MNKPLILVVDDEPKLVHLATEVLSAVGCRVLSAGSGEEAVQLVAMEKPDLILLDIILNTDFDGLKVARQVRTFSDTPIIMLTAKARESDILRGFEAGADDYIVKPFSAKELVARVKAVLKRSHVTSDAPRESHIQCGRLRIDLARRKVLVDDSEVPLTRTEYNLLHELAGHPNKVLFHEQLLTSVWGQEYRDDIDYLRAYVHHLRRKLEPNPAQPELIVTCPGVGYMLAVPEDPG